MGLFRRRESEPVPAPRAPACRVVVVTRRGCQLCVEAEAVAAEVCSRREVVWEAIDVDTDATLRAAYTDHVPVTFVDGRRLAYWGLAPDMLATALDRRN